MGTDKCCPHLDSFYCDTKPGDRGAWSLTDCYSLPVWRGRVRPLTNGSEIVTETYDQQIQRRLLKQLLLIIIIIIIIIILIIKECTLWSLKN